MEKSWQHKRVRIVCFAFDPEITVPNKSRATRAPGIPPVKTFGIYPAQALLDIGKQEILDAFPGYAKMGVKKRSAFMTIGEKIQYYRKKSGLSQEELGQKMLVSRQTVSLWEMDKILPTVDNLLLLKKIFCVSLDELLCETEPAETNVVLPKETYIFRCEPTDFNEVFKKLRIPFIKRIVVFALICGISFLFCVRAEIAPIMVGAFLGVFLLGMISYVKGLIAYKKAWRTAADKSRDCIYSYKVFDGYFVLEISRNGENIRTQKVYFDEIEKTWIFENYVVLQICGQLYILKKDMLPPGSILIQKTENCAKGSQQDNRQGISEAVEYQIEYTK